MKFRLFLAALFVASGLAGVVWWATAEDQQNPGERAEVVAKSGPLHHSAAVNQSTTRPAAVPPASPAESGQSIEPLLQRIHDASVTYDPKELSKIRPLLLHSDPGVRKAAVEGMIVLGDASAGTMLREASKSLQDPREAVVMLEAADYVELPSASQIVRKKKKKNPGGNRNRANPPAEPESSGERPRAAFSDFDQQ